MSMGSHVKGGGAEVGGGQQRAPTKPVRNERWEYCPVTGFLMSESQRVWQRGRYVHPKAVDRAGYQEPPDDTMPSDDASRPELSGNLYLEEGF